MSDIEKSFTFLHDNIPQWFGDISGIEDKIVRMQNEISKVPVSQTPRMKRKTGSVESIRDLDALMEDPSTSTLAQQSVAANRKRKTPSVLSGHASGPSKFRSRTMIIVYYDGEIQKSFEKLVRAIGTGRNMLRKGKMAAKMDALAELAGSDDEDSDESDDAVMSKIGYRHRAGLSSMRTRVGMMRSGRGMASSSSTPVELFDSTDKALELAQGLCERAAHQSLRDGDCRKELDGVRKHFDGVLEAARKEVAKYAVRKEKEAQEAAHEEPKMELSPSVHAPSPVPEPKVMLPEFRPSIGTTPTTSKVVDIEVDDEEEEDDMNFVMPPIRLTSRA